MSLTRASNGVLKPRGLWLRQFEKPFYCVLRYLTKVLKADQWEVLQVMLQVGAQEWQTPEGKKHIRELLQAFRETAPCEVRLPSILP
jgi:hypothetical protein